ncbi:MAG: prephenate dehydrogenase/arogenate dehydrogenase family protein [bacterium]
MSESEWLHIVGLGLIGGSVARGLKENNYKLTGWDKDGESRKKALASGLIEEAFPPEELPSAVDGVLLAVPVPAMVGIVREMINSGGNLPRYITDVGSTKNWIFEKMVEILPEGCSFIGGHPMAGSEKNGLEASDPLLFENAICVLSPGEKENNQEFKSVKKLWEDLGAHIMILDAPTHDRVVARVSHLPHLVAAALVRIAGKKLKDKTLPLAAGGFRDTTRIAGSDPGLWRDILETNSHRILETITEFQKALAHVESLLTEKNWNGLTDWLEESRELREEIPARTKGLLGSLFELRIQAPDRPGILSEVTGILGEAEINICDIEVLRVREGEKGTIKLAFRRAEEKEEAEQLLQNKARGIEII